MSSIRLIVGLGNPGERYENTPHNIGFEVLDRLAAEEGLRFRRAFGLQSGVSTWHVAGSRIRLLKPRTFMNASGVAVRKAVKRWKLPPEQVLLVYDEVSLPLGRLRIRPRGGAAGHNGVASVIRELDNMTDFPRLRLGVGPRPSGDKLIDYLLGRWDADKAPLVEAERRLGVSALRAVAREGVETAMNTFNAAQAATT